MPAIATKKPSRRQGNKVWVTDPSVKGGGFWRKVGPAKGKIGVGAIAGAALAGGAIAAARKASQNPKAEAQGEAAKKGLDPEIKRKLILTAKITAGAVAVTGTAAAGTVGLGLVSFTEEGTENFDLAARRISKNLPPKLQEGFENLQGEIKRRTVSGLSRAFGLKLATVDPEGRYTILQHEDQLIQGVGKSGRNLIGMTAAVADTPVNGKAGYAIAFHVNNAYEKKDKPELKASRKEALGIKTTLQDMYLDIYDKIPPDSYLIASPEELDGKGARRASIYKRFGFVEHEDGTLIAYKDAQGKPGHPTDGTESGDKKPLMKTRIKRQNTDHAIARGRELLQARLDRNSQSSRRRGNEVWVADPTVKGGGFWRKVSKRKSGVAITLAAGGAALLATQVARSKNTEKYSAPSGEQPQRPKPKLHKAVIIGGATAGLAGGIYAASQIPKTGNPMEDRGQSRSAQAALESSIRRQRENTKQLTGKLIIAPEEPVVPVETVTQTSALAKQTKGKKESRKKTTEEIHELALELGRRAAQKRAMGRQHPSEGLRQINTEKLLKAMKTDPKNK